MSPRRIVTVSSRSFFSEILVGMRQQHDGFFRMVHEPIRKARLVLDQQRYAILAGNILRRDDRELFPWNSFIKANS